MSEYSLLFLFCVIALSVVLKQWCVVVSSKGFDQTESA